MKPCVKTYFATEKFANQFIEKLKATSERSIKPKRAYLCPECLTWHLTSQDKNGQDLEPMLWKKIKEITTEKNKQIAELQKIISERNAKIRKLTEHQRVPWDKMNKNN